jgi:ferredoxin-type protein NapH
MSLRRQKVRGVLLLAAFCLFPAVFYYMSPYLIIDATLHRVVSGSFLLFGALFASALVFGRGFCAWVCPAGGAQEFAAAHVDRKVKRGNWLKWAIWAPWVSAIVLLAIQRRGYTQVQPFYQTTFGLSIDNVYALITYLLVLALIVVPALAVGKRSFCHHVCWMAPFLILGRAVGNAFKWPALRLQADPGRCSHCHTCSDHCPMSLDVEELLSRRRLENTECILCATCVDGCKTGALALGFRTPAARTGE